MCTLVTRPLCVPCPAQVGEVNIPQRVVPCPWINLCTPPSPPTSHLPLLKPRPLFYPCRCISPSLLPLIPLSLPLSYPLPPPSPRCTAYTTTPVDSELRLQARLTHAHIHAHTYAHGYGGAVWACVKPRLKPAAVARPKI